MTDYGRMFRLDGKHVVVLVPAVASVARRLGFGRPWRAVSAPTATSPPPRKRARAAMSPPVSCGLTTYRLDVLDDAAIERAAARARAVDVLVFTAATNVRKRIVDYADEEFDRVVDLNLRASFDLVRAFGTGMAARGSGSIVGFASIRA